MSRARAVLMVAFVMLVGLIGWTQLRGPQMPDTDHLVEVVADSETPSQPDYLAEDQAVMADTPATVEDGESYATVTLTFATNRNQIEPGDLSDAASALGDFNVPLWYGTAEVSIPDSHQAGQLEGQTWMVSMISAPNPEEHVILQAIEEMDRTDAIARIQDQLAVEDAVLLYVHGYNTTFEKAARRAGQLAYDLNWTGPAMFYSWPSRGQARMYTADQTMALRSERAMAQVLTDLAETDAGNIVVIAHSMGTQIFTQAYQELVETNPEAAGRITTVVLAAPDIDVGVFHDEIVPAFEAIGSTRVALYASAEDDALRASRAVNGFARIGDTSEGVAAIPGVDIIDATGAVSDFFGHTYFGDNATILSDIFGMVREGLDPPQRPTLSEVTTPSGSIWKIVLPAE